MKKMIKSLVAGLLSTGCLIAHGETQTAGGQTVTAIETAAVNVCSNPTNVATSPKGCVTNQLIRFNHIMAEEAATAVMGFKGTNGKISVIERINAIHVTDSQENINRMREIFRELDVPSPILEEVFVRQIKYAKATDIKTRLEKIVTESHLYSTPCDTAPKASGGPGFARTTPPPQPTRLLSLNNRPGLSKPEPKPHTLNAVPAVSDTDCGMIRGKVLIVADELSNKLIIVTQKENMDFFDKVIKSLDVEATPEVIVEMIRVKYAEAEDVVKMLHALLPKAFNEGSIKVLADARCNTVVAMASKADMAAIKRVIDNMDVKLAQVLLKTVIIQVELDDDLQTGADWIERGRQKFFNGDRLNIAAIIQAAKSDTRTKILYTPTLMTLDNKMTSVEATDMVYLLGSSCQFPRLGINRAVASEDWVRNYEKRDVGLTLKMLPRINPNGSVKLVIEERLTTRGTDQNIPNGFGGTTPFATISEYKRSYSIIAENQQTVMTRGLLGSGSGKEARSELLVFITPHVVD